MSSAELEQAAVDRAGDHGLDRGVALMQVLAEAVSELASDLPPELRPALASAKHRWIDMEASEQLEAWRIAAWHFLDEKNGNSTTIDDHEDIATRALICVLWDEPPLSDYDMTLDFFGNLMDRRRPGAAS